MRILALSMLLACGAMAGTALPAGTAAAQAGQAISDAKLGFSARLPGTANRSVTPGPAGGVVNDITSWVVDTGQSAYSVTVLEFQPGVLASQPAPTMLDSAINGGVGAIGGTETSRRNSTLAGLQAVEAQFTATVDGQAIVGRVIIALKGDLLYSVMTLEGTGSSDAAFRQLIRDFKLL